MKSLKKNILYQSIYQLLMVVSPLITAPYLARILGAEKLGIYSYYYSVAYYFGIFAILGMGTYGNRAVALAKTKGADAVDKCFSELVLLQGICAVPILVMYVFFVLALHENRLNATIELFYVISVAFDISWVYFGLEEFRTTSIRSFAVKILVVLCIFLFVKDQDDLNIYTAIMACGAFTSTAILWIPISRYCKLRRVNFASVYRHIKPNIMLFLPVVSLAMFHYMDKIMLGSMSGMIELGYYSNADKVINIPMGLIAGLGTVMLPRVSALRENEQWNTIAEYTNRAILFSLWLGTAMCFGILSVSKDFVPFFFGEKFEPCVSLLALFAFVIPIKAVSNVLKMQCLIPAGRDKEFNVSVLTAAITNIVLNALLIPRLAAIGAVAATIVAEAVVLVMYAHFSAEDIKMRTFLMPTVGCFAAGIAMYIALAAIKPIFCDRGYFFRLCVEVVVGALLYILVTLPFARRSFTKQEAKAL